MLKLIAIFLFVISSSVYAQSKPIWKCADTNVDSSFVINYDFTNSKGSIKLTIAGQKSTLKISSFKELGRPTTIWIKTTQPFMDENILMGFRLRPNLKNSLIKEGQLFYFDRTTDKIIGFDEEGLFTCQSLIKN